MQKHHFDKLTLLDHAKWQHPGIPEKKYSPRQWVVFISDCKKVKPEYNGVDPQR
jgi:hypothetical protein